MLFPQDNFLREVKNISGIWRFKLDKSNSGHKQNWFLSKLKKTIPMPVPSSFNDITTEKEIRDHVGSVWYETEFFPPSSWEDKSVILHFGSVTHKAHIWLNGKFVGKNLDGFLPFEFHISNFVIFGKKNRLTVEVNNVLDWTTLPPGDVEKSKTNHQIQKYYHDFYNYAGIHRFVKLVVLPKQHITDIKITTNIKSQTGIIYFSIKSNIKNPKYHLTLFSREEKKITEVTGNDGKIILKNPHLWDTTNPYLYTLNIELRQDNKTIDMYQQKIGIRTIKIKGNKLLLNNTPIYLQGFGKHEDADIRGKGFDNALLVKDFNLLHWVGANSFRTSHYPYAEEVLELADQEGFLIIDEVPAVGLNLWNRKEKIFTQKRAGSKMLETHLRVVEHVIERDKNHPSVIMWSIANEAVTYEKKARPYFKKVINRTRELDNSRPITIVNNTPPQECQVSDLVDIISVNRYFGWYTDHDQLDVIEKELTEDLKQWYSKFKKPLLLTEFGADTIAGLHKYPPVMFSEEFQIEFLKQYHKVLDKLPFIVGEHVWAFSDFATKQGHTRFDGNKKGIFTRTRDPKSAAFVLKQRWSK